MRGNVVDMAVGIVIGGAFGKIVSSFVADVLMPFVRAIRSRFSDHRVCDLHGYKINELNERKRRRGPSEATGAKQRRSLVDGNPRRLAQ